MAGEIIGEGELVITANTSAVDASLAKTSAAGDRAATSITGSFASAAKGLANSPLVGSLEQVAGKLGQVGGAAGQAAGFLASAIRPVAGLSAALGPLLPAVAALAAPGIGLAAMGLAARSMAEGAAEAVGRLRELGVVVNSDVVASVQGYGAATQGLSTAMDELRVAVGAPLVEPMTTLTQATTAYAQAATGMILAIDQDKLENFRRVLAGIMTLGVSEAAIAMVEYDASLVKLTATTEQYVALGPDMTFAAQREAEALRDITEGTRQQTLAREEAQRVAAAQRDLDAEIRAATTADAQFMQEQATASQAATAESVASLNEQYQLEKAIAAAVQADAESYVQAKNSMVEANQKVSAAQSALAAQTQQEGLARTQMELGLASQVLGNINSITDTAVASFERRAAAGEQFTAAEQQAYQNALAAQKVAAISTAGVQSAIVGISAFASLSSLGIPPFISGPMAAAIGVASFAAAVVGINSEQPIAGFDTSGGDAGAYNPGANSSNADGASDGIEPDNYKDVDRNGGAPGGVGSGQASRTSGGGGGGMMIGLDPALKRLTITSDRRLGKAARGSL
jgi:hypothetical protein